MAIGFRVADAFYGDSGRDRKLCPICRRYFRPKREKQRACGPPRRCWRVQAGRTLRARGGAAVLYETHARNRESRQARIDAICRERFGALTDRERELVAFADANGYRRGYALAYHRRRRSTAA